MPPKVLMPSCVGWSLASDYVRLEKSRRPLVALCSLMAVLCSLVAVLWVVALIATLGWVFTPDFIHRRDLLRSFPLLLVMLPSS